MFDFPPETLYERLHHIGVVGAPEWRYDGQFIWIPLPQHGYDKHGKGIKT